MLIKPLNPEDFEVEKDGVILHVMRFHNGNACVIRRAPNGLGPDVGAFEPYHNMNMEVAVLALANDGWTLRTIKQMSITNQEHGYNHTKIVGVCSDDVEVEDVEKRYYHEYFGGRGAWVANGKFGCIIHND